MEYTVSVPQMNDREAYQMRVVHAEVRRSRSGNDMLVMLLRTVDTDVTVNAFVLFNDVQALTNFAQAFNIPIREGKLTFDDESLKGRTVWATVRISDAVGGYVVRRFLHDRSVSSSVKVNDLGGDEDSNEDPFAELIK